MESNFRFGSMKKGTNKMNTLTIKSWNDFVEKVKMIKIHGTHEQVGFQKYNELCPCVVEVERDCIENIAKNTFEGRNEVHNKFGNDWERFLIQMNHVIYGREDFTDIPGSEYIGSDYAKVQRAFSFFAHERISGEVTRRQYCYNFGEKLCMNGIQFFEDKKLVILNFRSCDYIKKFPFDLLFINILLNDYNVKVDKLYCVFGSLHIYDGDKIK